jgi:hypothetical protein
MPILANRTGAIAERTLASQRAALAVAAALALAAPAAAQDPDFVSAPVTADMVLASMAICVGQLRAGAFDHAALTGAGWVSAVNAEGEPVLRGYRHPDNMILVTTVDSAIARDICIVMAPLGRGLTLDAMRATIEAQPGVRATRAGDATSWTADGLSFVLKPMGGSGLVIDIASGNP